MHPENSPQKNAPATAPVPDVNELASSQLPGKTYRAGFFQKRFALLSRIEQAFVLVRMQELYQENRRQEGHRPSRHFSGLKGAVRILSSRSDPWREKSFARLLAANPKVLDGVGKFLLREHKKYFPALLAALNAAYAGDDIGLLTARGNRSGHGKMIQAIEAFLGFQIPRHNIYFVNDESRNQRLGLRPTADKKLQILLDFTNGFYLDKDGGRRQMSKKYEAVLFYDDEEKNLSTVHLFAMAHGMSRTIRAIDAAKIPEAELWDALVAKVTAGHKPLIGQTNVIHFFDIDGTLIKVDAMMYVVDKANGRRLSAITQADLAAHPHVPFWLEKIAKESGVPIEQLEMDFADFRDPDRVDAQIERGKNDNKMFKPRRSG